jgi:hypothetical protein
MIRIAISVEAFEAIARTLSLGSVGYENQTNERGKRYVWLDPTVVSRLRFLRGPGESYSRDPAACGIGGGQAALAAPWRSHRGSTFFPSRCRLA